MTIDKDSNDKKLQEQIFNFEENSWNWEEFPEIEPLYDFSTPEHRSMLEDLTKRINFWADHYDGYIQYYFTLEYIVKYTGGKALLENLCDNLIVRGEEQEYITHLFAEFFHPTVSDDYYIKHITNLGPILIEGLCSDDPDFWGISKLFLKQVFTLLNALIHKKTYPVNPQDEDTFIESIFELLWETYRDWNTSIIEKLYEIDLERNSTLIQSFLASLRVKQQKIIEKIQKVEDEGYFIVYGSQKPPKHLPEFKIKNNCPITRYMELILTNEDKTELWIREKYFMEVLPYMWKVSSPKITGEPETLFFAHCEKLKAWVNNNFDYRMLYEGFSFQLLKKLVEERCIDNKILNDEIIKGIEHGTPRIINYLFETEFFGFMSELSELIVPKLVEKLEDASFKNVFYYYERGYLDLLPEEYFSNYFKQEPSNFINFIINFIISYFDDSYCEREIYSGHTLSKENFLNYLPKKEEPSKLSFLYDYISREDIVDIIAPHLSRDINPLYLYQIYKWDLVSRDFFMLRLTEILDLGDNSVNDAQYIVSQYVSDEEMLNLLPQRFYVIKEIVKKLKIDFLWWDPGFDENYLENLKGDDAITILLFSILNNDSIMVGIQHYPDVHHHFTWILEMLGKISSIHNITLVFNYNDLFTLPEDIPFKVILPQDLTVEIYEFIPSEKQEKFNYYRSGKSIKRTYRKESMKNSFEIIKFEEHSK